MEVRLTTDVRTEISLIKKLVIGAVIVGCLITMFYLFGSLIATDTLAAETLTGVKYNVSGNSQNKMNRNVWDILKQGDTVEITEQLKLKSNLDLTRKDIVIHLKGGELLWTAGYNLGLSENSKILLTEGGVLIGNAVELNGKMKVSFGKETRISWDGSNGAHLSFNDINKCKGYYKGPISLEPELLFFRSSLKKDELELEWATSAEVSNRCFEIQQSSDGQNFSTVKIVPGRGTTSKRSDYRHSFTEFSDSNHIVYFRLNQVTFNGESSTSPVVTQYLPDHNLALAESNVGEVPQGKSESF